MKLRILVNETYDEAKALYNETTNEILLTGDSYHDKIDEYIEGFLKGLQYTNTEYELDDEEEYITPNNELFNKCNFIDED